MVILELILAVSVLANIAFLFIFRNLRKKVDEIGKLDKNLFIAGQATAYKEVLQTFEDLLNKGKQ